MAVMVGMGEGGRSPFYILQLPINRPKGGITGIEVEKGTSGMLRRWPGGIDEEVSGWR